MVGQAQALDVAVEVAPDVEDGAVARQFREVGAVIRDGGAQEKGQDERPENQAELEEFLFRGQLRFDEVLDHQAQGARQQKRQGKLQDTATNRDGTDPPIRCGVPHKPPKGLGHRFVTIAREKA